jgi:Reverse transcriptase (RNA-dependent DNA polymerase)
LNLHWVQQERGVSYWETWETYAPVVTWAAIRLVLILVLTYKWYTVQIDFVIDNPQADVECDLFMKIPKGFEIEGKASSTHVLKLVKNLYGQKQAGRLHGALLDIGWRKSKIDKYLYYKGKVMFVFYIDDGILVTPSQDKGKRRTRSVEETIQYFGGRDVERLRRSQHRTNQRRKDPDDATEYDLVYSEGDELQRRHKGTRNACVL